jgi:hypothetical protein
LKLIDIFKPIDDRRAREIERQLQEEKQRLLQTTSHAATRVRRSFIERRWFAENPVETTLLILLGGYCVARWATERRKLDFASSIKPSKSL